jgi:signal transduction histidine kinase
MLSDGWGQFQVDGSGLRPAACVFGCDPEGAGASARDAASTGLQGGTPTAALGSARRTSEGVPESPETSFLYEAVAALLAEAPIGLIAVDHLGTCLLCEGQVLERVGLPTREVAGRPMQEALGREREILGCLHMALAGRPSTALLRTRTAALELRGFPFASPGSQELRAFCVVVEVTGQVAAQDRARWRRNRLARAQHAARIACWEWYPRDNRLEWSDEIFSVVGLQQAGVGDGIFQFRALLNAHDRTSLARAVRRAMAEDVPLSFDHRIRLPDGEERILHEEARVERDAGGEPLRLVGTVQDVTAWRRLEARARHAEKMGIVGRLAAGVAHDFNNILAVVRSFAFLLRKGLPAGDPRRESAEQIELATQRGEALTRQLLAVSRPQVLRPQLVAFDRAVDEIVPMLARLVGENVRIQTRLRPGRVGARIDPGQLEQILLNLVVNARDAMPAGGTVTVATCLERVEDLVAVSEGVDVGIYAVLSVADTGSGIAPEVLPHVFEPFFTTKAGGRGTGLGLATVLDIARGAGGFARASSGPGGATVEVLLPLIEPDVEARPADGSGE